MTCSLRSDDADYMLYFCTLCVLLVVVFCDGHRPKSLQRIPNTRFRAVFVCDYVLCALHRMMVNPQFSSTCALVRMVVSLRDKCSLFCYVF